MSAFFPAYLAEVVFTTGFTYKRTGVAKLGVSSIHSFTSSSSVIGVDRYTVFRVKKYFLQVWQLFFASSLMVGREKKHLRKKVQRDDFQRR